MAKVGLREHDQTFPRALRGADDLHILIGHIPAAVHDGYHKLRTLHGLAAAVYAEPLDGVLTVADAGGVAQAQRQRAETQLFFDGIARCAGDVGDNSALIAQQGVEQGAFARVRPPDYGSRDAETMSLPRSKLLSSARSESAAELSCCL